MAKRPTKKPVARKKPAAKPAASKTSKPKSKALARPRRVQSVGRVERMETEKGGLAFPIEIDPKRIEETLNKVADEVKHWANKGRYTKVRFKFRGKQLLPDLPFAAVMAAEGLTFYWGGILRALLVNVAGNAMLSVEIVNDSEKRVQKGKEELLSGEVDRAIEHFREAIGMQRDNPRAHLNLGVALKLKGDRAGARTCFEKVKAVDPDGAAGQEAERLLAGMRASAPVPFIREV